MGILDELANCDAFTVRKARLSSGEVVYEFSNAHTADDPVRLSEQEFDGLLAELAELKNADPKED